MTGFKPQLSLNGLPRADDFIQIWTDPDVLQASFPNWEGSDSDYVILSGLDRQCIARLVAEVKNRWQELSAFY